VIRRQTDPQRDRYTLINRETAERTKEQGFVEVMDFSFGTNSNIVAISGGRTEQPKPLRWSESEEGFPTATSAGPYSDFEGVTIRTSEQGQERQTGCGISS
jgi:hypothetical protein